MAENSAENKRDLEQSPQFEIPQTADEGQERSTERAIEKRQQSESAPTKQAPQFPRTTPVAPPPLPAPADQTSQPATGSSADPATVGLPAADVDLIEKQWVERAKSIVAQTQDDPYKQKKEMSKVKADYIKKRFNKTLPLDDAVKP